MSEDETNENNGPSPDEGAGSGDDRPMGPIAAREERERPVAPERAAEASAAAGSEKGAGGDEGKARKAKPTREEKAHAREDYRRAKVDMKAARRRAGKSAVPKVIACVLVAIVLAAGGAAAGWFFTNERGAQQLEALQGQLSSTRQQLEEANEQVQESNSVLDRGSRAYNGSWSGELISTLGASTKRCYGAAGKPMELDIEDITTAGQMRLGVRVLYHGHETATLPNDAERSSGDETLSADGITSTFNPQSFSFRVEGRDDGSYAVVTVSPTTSADAHIQLGAVVESYWKDGLVETDQYLLKKKGDDSSAPEGAGDAQSAPSSSEFGEQHLAEGL